MAEYRQSQEQTEPLNPLSPLTSAPSGYYNSRQLNHWPAAMRATEYPVPAGQRKASSGCKRPIRTSTGEDSAGAGAETPAAGPSAADRDSEGGACPFCAVKKAPPPNVGGTTKCDLSCSRPAVRGREHSFLSAGAPRPEPGAIRGGYAPPHPGCLLMGAMRPQAPQFTFGRPKVNRKSASPLRAGPPLLSNRTPARESCAATEIPFLWHLISAGLRVRLRPSPCPHLIPPRAGSVDRGPRA